jgi:hypothetical protein
VENFKHSSQSATTFAVSVALPVTATPEASTMVLRIVLEGERFVRRSGVGAVGGEEGRGGIALG